MVATVLRMNYFTNILQEFYLDFKEFLACLSKICNTHFTENLSIIVYGISV